jgi:hypothetical protein
MAIQQPVSAAVVAVVEGQDAAAAAAAAVVDPTEAVLHLAAAGCLAC